MAVGGTRGGTVGGTVGGNRGGTVGDTVGGATGTWQQADAGKRGRGDMGDMGEVEDARGPLMLILAIGALYQCCGLPAPTSEDSGMATRHFGARSLHS